MKRILLFGLFIYLASAPAFNACAQATTQTEPDVNNPLPKYMTEAEKNLPQPTVTRSEYDQRTPPTGTVHCPAEYEPAEGIFFSWQGYTDLLRDMTVSITTLDDEAIVYMVVDSTSEQSTVTSTLTSAGADMSQVEFIVRSTDTVWIRDYGPRFIFEDDQRAIVDHTYNRPRPNDNLLNDYISSIWGEANYDIPLEHGGGNFHLFADGDAFMSTLILTENSGMTEQQVKNLYADYQNLDLTIYQGFPTSFDSTQHIDMWMLPVADKKIIIGQYSSSAGTPYTITENAVTDLESRGYTVYRTPGWNSGGTHYTYTNAIILNDLVFMPQFGYSQDSTALSVFQTAFAGKTIIPMDCSSIIHAAGALHCICMHVPAYAPDPIPSIELLSPNGGQEWVIGLDYDITWQATDDVEVTAIDIYYSTDGGATYPYTIATNEPNDGLFTWTAAPPATDTCRIKVVARDADSNSAEDTSDADLAIAVSPDLIYSFPFDSDPGWSTEGLWQFGIPTGGGSHNHDPSSGHTGNYVYGYNLNGDYSNSMPVYYLTSTPIDCTGLADTELRFWKWLGVESSNPSWDHATVYVSNNGTDWTRVWNAEGENISDDHWNQLIIDISAIADNQPSVQIRWGMGTSDSSATFPGWNIDDVEIWAFQDIDFTGCITGPGNGPVPAECQIYDFDVDEDVDLADFATFQASFAE